MSSVSSVTDVCAAPNSLQLKQEVPEELAVIVETANPFENHDNPFDKLLFHLFRNTVDKNGYILPKASLGDLPDVPDSLIHKLNKILSSKIKGIVPDFTVKDLLVYFYSTGSTVELVGSSLVQFLGSAWFMEALKKLLTEEELASFYSIERLAFIDEAKSDIDLRLKISKAFDDPQLEIENFIEMLAVRQANMRDHLAAENLKNFIRSNVGPFKEANPINNLENGNIKNKGFVLKIETDSGANIDLIVGKKLNDENLLTSQDMAYDFTALIDHTIPQSKKITGKNYRGWQAAIDICTQTIHCERFHTTAWKKVILSIGKGKRILNTLPASVDEFIRRYCNHKDGLDKGFCILLKSISEKYTRNPDAALCITMFNILQYLLNNGYTSREIAQVSSAMAKSLLHATSGWIRSLSTALKSLPYEIVIQALQLKYWNSPHTIIHNGLPHIQFSVDDLSIFIPLQPIAVELSRIETYDLTFLNDLPPANFGKRLEQHPENLLLLGQQLVKSTNPTLKSLSSRFLLAQLLLSPSLNLLKQFLQVKLDHPRETSDIRDVKIPILEKVLNSWEEILVLLLEINSDDLDDLIIKIWSKQNIYNYSEKILLHLLAKSHVNAVNFLKKCVDDGLGDCLLLNLFKNLSRVFSREVDDNFITTYLEIASYLKHASITNEEVTTVTEICVENRHYVTAYKIFKKGVELDLILGNQSYWFKHCDAVLSNPQFSIREVYDLWQWGASRNIWNAKGLKNHRIFVVNFIERLYLSGYYELEQLAHELVPWIPKSPYPDGFAEKISSFRERHRVAMAEIEAAQGHLRNKIKIIEKAPVKAEIITTWTELCKRVICRKKHAENLSLCRKLLMTITPFFSNDIKLLKSLVQDLIRALQTLKNRSNANLIYSCMEGALILIHVKGTDQNDAEYLDFVVQNVLILLDQDFGIPFPESLIKELSRVHRKAIANPSVQKSSKDVLRLSHFCLTKNIHFEPQDYIEYILPHIGLSETPTEFMKEDKVQKVMLQCIKTIGEKNAENAQKQSLSTCRIIEFYLAWKKGDNAFLWIKHYIYLLQHQPIKPNLIILQNCIQYFWECYENESNVILAYIEKTHEFFDEKLTALLHRYPSEWISANAPLFGRVIRKLSPDLTKIESFQVRVNCTVKSLLSNRDRSYINLALELVNAHSDSPELLTTTLKIISGVKDADLIERTWQLFLRRFIPITSEAQKSKTFPQEWSAPWAQHLNTITKLYKLKCGDTYLYDSALAQLALYSDPKYGLDVHLRNNEDFKNLLNFLFFFVEMPGNLPKNVIDMLFAARDKITKYFTSAERVKSLKDFDCVLIPKAFQTRDPIHFHNAVQLLYKIFEGVNESDTVKSSRLPLFEKSILASVNFYHNNTWMLEVGTAVAQILKLIACLKPDSAGIRIALMTHPASFERDSGTRIFLEPTYQDRNNLKILPPMPKRELPQNYFSKDKFIMVMFMFTVLAFLQYNLKNYIFRDVK